MLKRILIADESEKSRESIINTLKSAGYDVVEASNGLDALNLLKQNSIDLLISDVNMDGMDGITLIKIMKGDESIKQIPVIILTTETDDDIITEGRLTGARVWMLKPFQPEILIDTVKKIISAVNN